MSRLFSVCFTLMLFMLSGTAWGKTSSKLKEVSIEKAFDYFVNNPNHLTICNSMLWTFSEHDQSLIAINAVSGIVRHSFNLSPRITSELPLDAAAITCKNNRLFVLVNGKQTSKILELQVGVENIKTTQSFSLPQNRRATDLFCNDNKCWLMQGEAYESADLKNWLPIKIPKHSEIKKVNARPDLDPFEDWQSQLVLAKQNYTRVTANKKNEPVFLDPFRQEIVFEKDGLWYKWGRFGMWEGFLLAPKAMTFLSDEVLAIADAKLKIISLFSRSGTYLGVLTIKSDYPYTPDYPLGLSAIDKRIFVSDFASNKVIAFNVGEISSEKSDSNEINIRKNLFRRPEVLKDAPSLLCMNCHDGSVSNQLFKYIQTHFHHPLECSQCHDPHHNSKEHAYLRKPEKQLCQSCHSDYNNPETNHVWHGTNKKGGTCLDCHKSHTNFDKLLVQQTPSLCMNCHKTVKMNHVSVKLVSDLDKAKSVVTDNGELKCQTCHKTHINYKDKHFIKPPAEVLTLCSGCHGDKAPTLFTNFHKIFDNKKRAR